MSDRSAASGRPAVALTRDSDYERFVAAVHYLPSVAQERGVEVAWVWASTELRSLLDLLVLGKPTTSEAKARQRVHIALSEATVRVMARRDLAGLRARADFITAVERTCLAPTLRAVFEKSRDEAGDEGPYIPETDETA
jgi:hypothetical protein